jgi:3',5'-cyclic AMP phosphodiesterase CpdA
MNSHNASSVTLALFVGILCCLVTTGAVSAHDNGNPTGSESLSAEMPSDNTQAWYFIHITDTHVGGTSLGSLLRFVTMVNSINALNPPPEFVVITGDLVDEASSANYQMFNSVASQLLMDYYTCPGNHDYRGLLGIEEYRLCVRPDLDYTWQHSGIEMISMDSGSDEDYIEGDTPPYELDMLPEATGFTALQYAWLDSCLNETPETGKVLCMHHPVVCCEEEYNYDEGSGNACIYYCRPEVWGLLKDPDDDGNPEDAVKVVLSGHTHWPYEYEADDLGEPSTVSIPPGGYVSTDDYTLPLYIITAAALDLAYRKIEVHGQEMRVFENTYFEGFWSIAADWLPRSIAAGSGKSDSICDPAGRLHAYDSAGNHVGIGEADTVEFEISDACYRGRSMDDDSAGCHRTVGEEISVILSAEDYDFILEAADSARLHLVCEFVTESDGRLWLSYPDIDAYPASRGSLSVYGDSVDYTLYWDENGDGMIDAYIDPDVTSSVEQRLMEPTSGNTRLSVLGPNPFSGTVAARVSVSNPGPVSVDVYDVTGKKVRSLFSGRAGTGAERVLWDGNDDTGRPAASGVYFICLKGGSFTESARVVLLR